MRIVVGEKILIIVGKDVYFLTLRKINDGNLLHFFSAFFKDFIFFNFCYEKV